MVKRLFFRMLAQKSKLESQISILEARNNEIHVQNEGLRDQVASLRATVDSLEQGLKAAPSTSQAQGSTTNETRALVQHNNYSVTGQRGHKELGNGIPYNRQICRPNPIVIYGKSLMEIPSPKVQPRIARSLNTDTVKHHQHTNLLKPVPQFMAIKPNGSTICLNALMSQKPKQCPLLALLRTFRIPWYSYNSIPSPISRPSEPANQLTRGNAPLAKEHSTGEWEIWRSRATSAEESRSERSRNWERMNSVLALYSSYH